MLLTDPEMAEWQEFRTWAAQGHTVHTAPDGPLSSYDVVFGPNAWRMTERHRPWLADALAEARKRRYGAGKD